MVQKKFSVIEALKFGFVQAYKHLGISVVIAIIFFVLQLATKYDYFTGRALNMIVSQLLNIKNLVLGLDVDPHLIPFDGYLIAKTAVIQLLFLLAGTWFYLGAIKIALDITDSKSIHISTFINEINHYPLSLLGYICYYFLCGLGLLFFYIGSFFVAFRLYFFMHFIIDQGTSSLIDAFTLSYHATEGKLGAKFFSLLALRTILLGGISLSILFFATKLPFTAESKFFSSIISSIFIFPMTIAITYAYRQLASKKNK